MGTGWWFWLFFAAFPTIGFGVSQIIRLEGEKKYQAEFQHRNASRELEANERASLPPKQTTYASEIPSPSYETGEMVPPSVTENTTRHLEMESEAKTRTLSEDDVADEQ